MRNAWARIRRSYWWCVMAHGTLHVPSYGGAFWCPVCCEPRS